MKEINMTKAISCMPDKFITMEMVELAATEHRPELVNYLPEKYITSEILDSIFKTDDYGWRSWQLSKIPEEKRNRQICLRAIKAEKSNFPDIPEKYRNSDILESLFAHRNFMHYLHLIPSSSWNNGPVRDAIYSLYRDVQQNGGYRYCSERYEQQFLYETSVMLSFVPRQAKDFRLWKELIHDGRIATMTIDKMMPKCFKQAAYYKEWAIRCIKEVDTRWLDYDTVWKAICHKTGNLHGIFDSYGHYEWFSKHADDAMADKAMELEPNLFNKLPRRFRTPERLIHTLEVKREINSYNFILEPNLMTKEVCMALARRDSFYPDIPSERWNRELVEYFTEYGFHRNAGTGNLWNISPNTETACIGSLNCRKNYRPENLPRRFSRRSRNTSIICGWNSSHLKCPGCYVKKTRIISVISRSVSWSSRNIQDFRPNSMDVKRISSISEIVMTAADTAV